MLPQEPPRPGYYALDERFWKETELIEITWAASLIKIPVRFVIIPGENEKARYIRAKQTFIPKAVLYFTYPDKIISKLTDIPPKAHPFASGEINIL